MGRLASTYFGQAQMGRIQHAQNYTQKGLNHTQIVLYTSVNDLFLWNLLSCDGPATSILLRRVIQ